MDREAQFNLFESSPTHDGGMIKIGAEHNYSIQKVPRPMKEESVVSKAEFEDVDLNCTAEEGEDRLVMNLPEESSIAAGDNDAEYTSYTPIQHFQDQHRSQLIGLTSELTPAPSEVDELDNWMFKLQINPANKYWAGKSIFANLPAKAVRFLDDMMVHGHKAMLNVIKTMNKNNPIDIEYNPKKSNSRVDEPSSKRIFNNNASRRSRQRKKFVTKIRKYYLEYVQNDNKILGMQEGLYTKAAINTEQILLESGKMTGEQIRALRVEFGLM